MGATENCDGEIQTFHALWAQIRAIMEFKFVQLLTLLMFLAYAEADPRPLFVFGHMANSLPELEDFIAQGVNAIEADVTFAANGTALKFYHGPGCDCGRDCEKETEIGTYLSYLRNGVAAGGQFAGKLLLFYCDIKTGDIDEGNKYNAGVSLAENLISYLWKNVPSNNMLNVLLSIFSVDDKDVLKGALETLSKAENASSYLDHVVQASTASSATSQSTHLISSKKIRSRLNIGSRPRRTIPGCASFRRTHMLVVTTTTIQKRFFLLLEENEADKTNCPP